jgi:hypothetical protein
MCVGKIYWAGFRSVAFALPSTELGTLAGPDFLVPCTELFMRATERVTIIGPRLIEDARQVHLGYWDARTGDPLTNP